MINIYKITKSYALKVSSEITPEYAKLFSHISKFRNQSIFPNEIAQLQLYCRNYVSMYDDENKIGIALFLCYLGQDGFKDFQKTISELSETEQLEWFQNLNNDDIQELTDSFSSVEIPQTPEEWQASKDKLNELSEDERKDVEKRSTLFWYFTFSSFFNTLSLMIHGAKLTTLVPLSIAGDDYAFLKAIQIDRMLLLHHPYFQTRKLRAQDEQDKAFLAKIAYRESNPILSTKVRYPALYMLFGILETFGWLDDLKHREILDICDQAELDRYQNRIESENALTKRLLEYRRWQKSRGTSMH